MMLGRDIYPGIAEDQAITYHKDTVINSSFVLPGTLDGITKFESWASARHRSAFPGEFLGPHLIMQGVRR